MRTKQTMNDMLKYRVVRVSFRDPESLINQMADSGWSLVTWTGSGTVYEYMVFSKQK